MIYMSTHNWHRMRAQSVNENSYTMKWAIQMLWLISVAFINTVLVLFRWEFQTEENDIGFGIRRKATEEGKPAVEVLPIKRFNCQHVMEDGNIICDTPGKCKQQMNEWTSEWRQEYVGSDWIIRLLSVSAAKYLTENVKFTVWMN